MARTDVREAIFAASESSRASLGATIDSTLADATAPCSDPWFVPEVYGRKTEIPWRRPGLAGDHGGSMCSDVDPVIELSVAWMVVSPVATALATPSVPPPVLIVAIAVSVEVQMTSVVMTCVELSE
jgi:hypothetical protein